MIRVCVTKWLLADCGATRGRTIRMSKQSDWSAPRDSCVCHKTAWPIVLRATLLQYHPRPKSVIFFSPQKPAACVKFWVLMRRRSICFFQPEWSAWWDDDIHVVI